MRRRFGWVFAALALVVVLLIAWAVFHKPPAKPAPPPAVPVAVAKATVQDVPLSVAALGAAQAWTSDTIYAQVSGKLISVNFAEGSYVKAGQVLAEVDPGPYRAALLQAQGALKRDQAILAGAKVDLARYALLTKQDSIARQTYEDQVATVNQDEGTVVIDQGEVATAKINLGWCKIVSPISGRAGVRLVDPGNLVSASGSTSSTPNTSSTTSSSSASTANATSTTAASTSGQGIVIINQVQPMAVTFSVPQADFQRLVQASHAFRQPLSVEALSQETGASLGTGALSIADNRIDPTTGTVELKARFPNADNVLWSGELVNVELTLQTVQNAVTAPLGAVSDGPKGPYVFVVGNDGHARMQPVQVAETEGQLDVIESGLKGGETLVIDGQMTLKQGSRVRIAQTQATPQAERPPPPNGPPASRPQAAR